MPMEYCICGSGRRPYELKDARGIFCAFVCESCEAAKRERYRSEIFTDPNYQTEEPVEPEDNYADRVEWRSRR